MCRLVNTKINTLRNDVRYILDTSNELKKYVRWFLGDLDDAIEQRSLPYLINEVKDYFKWM